MPIASCESRVWPKCETFHAKSSSMYVGSECCNHHEPILIAESLLGITLDRAFHSSACIVLISIGTMVMWIVGWGWNSMHVQQGCLSRALAENALCTCRALYRCWGGPWVLILIHSSSNLGGMWRGQDKSLIWLDLMTAL